jgi:hypothetical protein
MSMSINADRHPVPALFQRTRDKSPRTGWFLVLVHDEQVVPRYAVCLQVHADRPLTQHQLGALDGGPHGLETNGRPRARKLTVSLTVAGGDVAGALARSLNVVLDQVPGDVRHAKVTSAPRGP